MDQKGEFTAYVNKVKKLVESGEIGKPEANIMILGKVQQLIAQASVSKKQFMLDQQLNSQEVL